MPAWQLELEDRDRKNTYVRVDETGEQETTNDPRDTLASEMADLKSRKIMGEQKQRMLREEAARRGHGTVRAFSADHQQSRYLLFRL